MWLVALLLLLVIAVPAAYKLRTNAITTGLAGINEFYDFVNIVKGSPFDSSSDGGATVTGEGLTNRSTLVNLNTFLYGVSQYASIATGGYAAVIQSGQVLTVATDLAISGDSAIAPDSNFKFGLGGTLFTSAGTAESYLMADRTVSDNWIAVRKNSAGTTQTITTVPVSINIGTDYTPDFTRLKIISDISRSLYYIDAVLVATITNRAWTTGDHLGICARLQSTNPDITSVHVDYISLYYSFSPPRQNP